MNLLQTIIGFFKTEALDIWSKVSLSFNAIFNTLIEDEVKLIGLAKDRFTKNLAAGMSWGEAAADLWTFVKDYEGVELSKVGNLFLQAFIAHFEPPAA